MSGYARSPRARGPGCNPCAPGDRSWRCDPTTRLAVLGIVPRQFFPGIHARGRPLASCSLFGLDMPSAGPPPPGPPYGRPAIHGRGIHAARRALAAASMPRRRPSAEQEFITPASFGGNRHLFRRGGRLAASWPSHPARGHLTQFRRGGTGTAGCHFRPPIEPGGQK
jgi:hypothetical protein